jgi:hypothetical protein
MWRDLIGGHRDAAPEFEPSEDLVLVEFLRLFLTSELAAFDADKRLRTDALSPLFDCETVSVRAAGASAESFAVIWTPVWQGTDPLAGFRTGHDSAYLGSTPTVAMPPDERTDALLLLVTSQYVHLSAMRDGARVVVRGAVDDGENTFRFVELVPDAVAAETAALAPDPTRSTSVSAPSEAPPEPAI